MPHQTRRPFLPWSIGLGFILAALLALAIPVYGQQATPTATPSPANPAATASVTALVDANVRKGDDTHFPAVGYLLTGKSAAVQGISSRHTGWFYIELSDGTHGFIAPSVVKFTGDAKSLPAVKPPPLPTPAAGAPVAPASGAASGVNLTITGMRLDPLQPVCNQTFNIYVNVANVGRQRSPAGILTARDFSARTADVGGAVSGGFPEIDPGQNYVVVLPLTIIIYTNEAHRIVLTVDSSSQVAETNEADNITHIDYALLKGDCP